MHKSFSLALLFISFFFQVSAFALDDTQVLDKEKVAPSDITLRSFTSCENMDTVLTGYFRKALLDQMSVYGTPGGPFDDRVAMPALEKGLGIGGGGNETSFSQTNVQVVGIDESEVVKTDGTYIYYASNQPDTEGYQYVTITRATPAQNMEMVKRIKLPTNYGNIQLYVADKTLTILATKWNQNFAYSASPITIGHGSSTVVITYDVTSPEQPKLTRFYTINGDLSQSRRDGDFLYVLSQNYVGLNMWGVAGMYTKEDVKTYLDKKFDAQSILPETVEIHTDDKNEITV